MTTPHKRPLVNTAPIDEFGAITQDDGFDDPNRLDRDFSYTPGWSELRRQRDTEMAEYVNGRRLGQDVTTLPVNVRLVRRVAADMATPSGTKLLQAVNDGYRPVTREDIGQTWFKQLPPGAREQSDGTIVNVAGDLQYVVATAEQAAKLRRKRRQASANQVEASAERHDGLLQIASKIPGANPSAGRDV